MSVHYKFKSALDFDTITFDGLHISVNDLKKAIIHQKRLGKTADFDLQITNAQTKEEYTDDGTLIPKNTSLIIARIPLAVQPKKPWDPQADKVQGGVRQAPEPDSGTLDLSQMNGTEEDKINAMMIQSTMDYDPNNYQKIRGQGQTGEVPANYRCFKCHKPGHWIKNCPLGNTGEPTDIKRNTGIPRSFIERDSQEKTAEQQPQPPPVPEKKQEIPEDLICGICKDLFTDAVMIPCCGSSFCDDCVRTALLESEDNECPDCKEKGSSPGSLIPNRFLRNSVNAFKNETGYNKPRRRKEPPKPKEAPAPAPIVTASQPAEKPEISTNASTAEATSTETAKLSPPRIEEKEKEKEPPAKERKEQETVEKKTDPGALSSHDESDFEDNITVTIPPAHLQGPMAFKERQYNGRHGRHPRPPGIENSPKAGPLGQTLSPRDHRSGTPIVDEKESASDLADHTHKHHPLPSHHPPSREQSMRIHRSAAPSDAYGNGPPVPSYPQGQPMMGPGRPYDMGVYGVPPGPSYPPYMMGERMRGPYHPPRPGFPHIHPIRPRHMAPPNTLASVYQGVQAKVGTGIIDDPLEAFNRIMREKEKRKEERRRSPDRSRRSRSIEMNLGRMRHSPPPYNRGRNRSPEERRLRTPPPRERRGRSREREKRSPEKEKRRHRSSSFSDRSSRSRSWSIPPRRRSKSPLMVRRRTRSRSPSFSMSRSRSRSNSQGRFRGPAPPMRYNRSPLRPMSPRYRQKENRRPADRREDFPRDDFRERERSPYHYQPSRRPRSRGRIISPGIYRQERPPPPQTSGHGQEQFYHQIQPVGMYNEAPSYNQNNNRYPPSRDGPPPPPPPHNQPMMSSHRDSYGNRDRNPPPPDYKMDRFDDGPPGTDEPPPPGFENTPERGARRNSWNHQFDGHGYRDDYNRKQDNIKKDYIDRAHTPEMREMHDMRDMREMQSLERDERHRHEIREREGRSWSRASRHSSNNNRLRRGRSRSRSPLRLDRIPDREHFINRDRNPSKEQHMNRERYSPERQMHNIDKERSEHEKQKERNERERKNVEKKHGHERKGHEKESRHVSKDDKDRDKEKYKDVEKEKDKRRESSEEEKKDKKTKEKRKKKKEKDAEKKKKKDKKEKEKKLKEKEKEKQEEKEKEKIEEMKVAEEEEREKIKEFSIEKEVPEKKNDEDEHPPAMVENMSPEIIKPNKMLEDMAIMQEDQLLLQAAEHERNVQKEKDIEILDLYGDICQEEEIRFEYPSSNLTETDDNPQKDVNNKVSPTEIKRFDSILDIHDFEPDLDEIAREDTKRDSNVLVPLPELSKWELEEDIQSKEEKRPPSANTDVLFTTDEKTGKVTNEVIRRAENAIFARAINAIRPIEIKKISVERQKLYANEPPPIRELTSPPPSMIIKSQSPTKELPSFQITVPTNSTSSERSVEIKADKQKRTTPVRSVKDRLGSKVPESVIPKRNRSRSTTPPRKITIEGSRIEKVRTLESSSRSRERHRGPDDNKDPRRVSEIRRPNEANRSRDRDRNSKDYKPIDNNRNREPLPPRGRDNDRRRDHVGDQRSRDHQWGEQERIRDREREQRDREREQRMKERRRTPEKSRDHEYDRDKNKIREQQRGGERERERQIGRDQQQDRLKEKQPRSSSRDNKSKEHPKSGDDRDKSKQRFEKKERSRSRSSEKKDKKSKHEKDSSGSGGNKRKRSEDRKSHDREKKGKIEKSEKDTRGEIPFQRKKSIIDEASFVPDYDEQPDQEQQLHNKTGENIEKNIERPSKEKGKTPEASKRSRSASPSSSSSSSSDTESNSDSEDNKKKKKRKHKKKKSKRASSADTSSSTKHKKKKKKSKSSKKKKKNKK